MVVSEAEKSALETMARSIPGTVGVDRHLTTRGSWRGISGF
jgi:hypothetical protein